MPGLWDKVTTTGITTGASRKIIGTVPPAWPIRKSRSVGASTTSIPSVTIRYLSAGFPAPIGALPPTMFPAHPSVAAIPPRLFTSISESRHGLPRWTRWRSLGFFIPNANGDLSVSLSTLLEGGANPVYSDGIVVADAVMIVEDWDFETPVGSFNQLDAGELDDTNGYWSFSENYINSHFFDLPPGDWPSRADQPADGDFTLLTKDGTRYFFNEQGLLERHVDRNQNATVYEYEDKDNDTREDELVTITSPYGIDTTYQYNGSGRLQSITNVGEGNVTNVNIDSNGFLWRITLPDPDGITSGSFSDVIGIDLSQNKPSPVFDFNYPALGSLPINQRLLAGVKDAHNNYTIITNSTTSYRVQQVNNPDSAGNANAGLNLNGATETRRWLVTPQLADGLNSALRRPISRNRIGDRTSIGASPLPEPKALYTDPRNYVWEYQTDEFGLEVAMAIPAATINTTPNSSVWRKERNEDGLVTRSIEPPGAGGTSNFQFPLITRYEYDGSNGPATRGNLTKIIYAQPCADAPQNQIEEGFEYNQYLAQLTKHTRTDGKEITFSLDPLGNAQERCRACSGGRCNNFFINPRIFDDAVERPGPP